MKNGLAIMFIVSLGACQTVPPAPAADYRAIGTEPFWDLSFAPQLVFTDRGNGVIVAEPLPRPIGGKAGTTYRGRRIIVTITPGPCSDGMSDRVYPDSVLVQVDGQPYRGCGAEAAFFRRTAP